MLPQAQSANAARTLHKDALIIIEPAKQGDECNPLQHRIAMRVRDDFFFCAIATRVAKIDQAVERHALPEIRNRRGRVPFLPGKEFAAVSDNEAEVARAGLIGPRIIDFVEDAVAQCAARVLPSRIPDLIQ